MRHTTQITNTAVSLRAFALFFAMVMTIMIAPAVSMASGTSSAVRPQVLEAYGKLPLSFEANQGQTDNLVKFLSRGPGYTLFLTPTELMLSLRQAAVKPANQQVNYQQTVLRLQLIGTNPPQPLTGIDELPGKANYFIGNDPKNWRTNIPTYAKVQQYDVYPGVDVVYYGNQRQVEFDFIVAPEADPKAIRLSVEGADRLEVDAQGDLVMHSGGGQIRVAKPLVYQVVDGVRREVSGSYVLTDGHKVGFQIAAYDATKPLIIDPTLLYSTYLGGNSDDVGYGIGVDAAGNAYVAGYTSSTNFPTTAGAFQTASAGGYDAFVTKLNPTGSALVYSTYLGGSGDDVGYGIALDAAGNAYVTGTSRSTNFPTTAGAFQTAYGGGLSDDFVTKLNPTGSALVYSTYLGGSGEDGGPDRIAVDAAGNAYVTGITASGNFPTTAGAFQTAFAGGPYDAFVTKVDPTGSGLVYSTYLGGNSYDQGNSIAVDAAGNAYVTGVTAGSNFPTTPGAFQTAFGGGCCDAFVTKLNPTGTGLVYSTYLGGSGEDIGFGITVDTAGNAYVTGLTTGSNFPTTPGAFQTAYGGGGFDAFVTRVNPTGTGLVYSTYLGGSGTDIGNSIALDAGGNAYVTGTTDSVNFPTVNPVQAVNGGGTDAFVTQVNPTASALVYSTYLGGSGNDQGIGIVLDSLPSPNAYVTGTTGSTNFPVTAGAFQTTFGGGSEDAFVAKIAQVTIPSTSVGKVTSGGTITVTGGIANFGFVVQSQSSTGPIAGDLQYVNHATGAKVHSVAFTSFAIVGNTATFGGTCTINGSACTFTVNVTDNGEPGTNDTFTISVNGGSPEGGTLRSGNIQIHQ